MPWGEGRLERGGATPGYNRFRTTFISQVQGEDALVSRDRSALGACCRDSKVPRVASQTLPRGFVNSILVASIANVTDCKER